MKIGSEDAMRYAGMAITLVGTGLSLAGSVIKEKQMDLKIAKKVGQVIANIDFKEIFSKDKEC